MSGDPSHSNLGLKIERLECKLASSRQSPVFENFFPWTGVCGVCTP